MNSLFTSLKELSKYSTIIIGLLYALGLTILNIHLSKYGISETSLFSSQYITIGVVFIWFVCFPLIIIYIIVYTYEKTKDKAIRALILITELFSFFGFYIILCEFLFNPGLNISNISIVSKELFIYFFIILLLIFFLYIFFFKGTKYRRYLQKSSSNLEKYFSIIIKSFTILFICLIYSFCIFPMINKSFSGGKPIPLELIISEEGIKTIKSLGLEVDSKNKIKNNIKLIHATSDIYYIVPPSDQENTKCLGISSELVKGIKYLKGEKAEELKEKLDSLPLKERIKDKE